MRGIGERFLNSFISFFTSLTLIFLHLVIFVFIHSLLVGIFAIPIFLIFNINTTNYIYVLVLILISAVVRLWKVGFN